MQCTKLRKKWAGLGPTTPAAGLTLVLFLAMTPRAVHADDEFKVAAPPTVAPPDLTVGLVLPFPSRAGTTHVIVWVTNHGKGPSRETIVQVQSKSWSTAQESVPPLKAGAKTSVDVAFQTNLTPGTYDFEVVVDPHGDIGESNLGNNRETGSFVISAPVALLPDLVVEAATSVQQPGMSPVIHVRVKNVGNAAAAPTEVAVSSAGWPDQRHVVPALAKGVEAEVYVTVPAPLHAGTFRYTAMVNPSQSIKESNFGNNEATGSLAILGSPANLVLRLTSARPGKEGSAVVTTSVKNDGGSASAATDLVLKLSGKPPVRSPVPALAIKGSARVQTTIRGPFVPGTYSFVAIVDPDGHVGETTRSDDQVKGHVVFPAPPGIPDLAIRQSHGYFDRGQHAGTVGVVANLSSAWSQRGTLVLHLGQEPPVSVPIPELRPSGSVVLRANVSPSLSPGSYPYEIEIVPSGPDGDATNNSASGTLVVPEPPSPIPWWAIASILAVVSAWAGRFALRSLGQTREWRHRLESVSAEAQVDSERETVGWDHAHGDPLTIEVRWQATSARASIAHAAAPREEISRES